MVFPCQPPIQSVGKSFQISIFGKYVPYVPRLEPQTLLGRPSDRESCLIPTCLCVLCSGVCVSDSFVTLWTVAHQASLSTGFSRQEYWSGLPCLSPEDLPHPRMEPKCLVSQADSLSLFFLVLPLYFYQPISLHPHAHVLSHVIPWTAARQAPLSMDFSSQEYWSGLPFPSPTGRLFTTEPSGKPPVYFTLTFYSPLLSCHFHEIKVHLL